MPQVLTIEPAADREAQSLLTGVLDQAYDIFERTDSGARDRYLDNLYQASCQMYRGFADVLQRDVIPSENFRVVPYSRLVSDLEATMSDLLEFIEVQPSDDFRERLRTQAESQRDRQSDHRYSLEKFGLSADRIRSDLDFVYQLYDL